MATVFNVNMHSHNCIPVTVPARNKLRKIAIDDRTRWSIAELSQSRLQKKHASRLGKEAPSTFVMEMRQPEKGSFYGDSNRRLSRSRWKTIDKRALWQ